MNKARTARIGLFTMVAAARLVGGVLLFGGTRWLEPSSRATLFFEESVGGLSIGSNVNFRGVRVGEVESLELELDPDTAEALVVVTVRLTQSDQFGGGPVPEDNGNSFTLQYWIDQGLVAQLNADSLVTGQLSIQLNFSPEASPAVRDRNTEHPQIPVIRSEIAQVREALANVDWRGLIERFDTTLTSISELSDRLESELSGVGENIQATSQSTELLVQEVRDTLARTEDVITRLGDEAANTLNSYNQLSDDASTTLSDISELSRQSTASIADLSRQSTAAIADLSEQMNQTLDSVERFSDTAGDTVDGRGDELSRVLSQTEQTLTGINRVVEQLEGVTDPRSQERDDLRLTLRNLAAASAAIERIADMIERDPQSIFLGSEGDQR